MKLTSPRFSTMLPLVVALFSATGAVEADAQTADVAGEWTFTVTTDQTGVTNPMVTLEQDGMILTGQYSSETLGNADLSGSVDGSEVTFSFSGDAQGQTIDALFSGAVDENGQMSGTVDFAGGLLTGTFTAIRSDG
ncbi:MAG TPA: hypothetical protein EYQ64_06935 [Gemmatimonadetes bacterium]|nr:hypothetical protein [Gemmatimonadota bacterium]